MLVLSAIVRTMDVLRDVRRDVRRNLLALLLTCLATGVHAQAATITASPDAQLLHAYTLAELGRHSEAIQAFEQINGRDADGAALGQERSAYSRALQFTQDCATDKSCMAEDFLAAGKLSEALSWQKQRIKSIRDEQKANLRKDETDSTGGKSVVLADAYDLQARIEAAMGQLDRALNDLDAAVNALPSSPKTEARAAGYAYHRALILAESHKFVNAAKACQESLRADDTTAALGERRQLQCNAIEKLARTPAR